MFLGDSFEFGRFVMFHEINRFAQAFSIFSLACFIEIEIFSSVWKWVVVQMNQTSNFVGAFVVSGGGFCSLNGRRLWSHDDIRFFDDFKIATKSTFVVLWKIDVLGGAIFLTSTTDVSAFYIGVFWISSLIGPSKWQVE